MHDPNQTKLDFNIAYGHDATAAPMCNHEPGHGDMFNCPGCIYRLEQENTRTREIYESMTAGEKVSEEQVKEEFKHLKDYRARLVEYTREEVKRDLAGIATLREPATAYKDGGGEEWEQALKDRYGSAAAELSYAVDAGQTEIATHEFVHALHYLEKIGAITIM